MASHQVKDPYCPYSAVGVFRRSRPRNPYPVFPGPGLLWYDACMPSITDTPVLVTPPEHELPVVLAFWDAYDDAYDAFLNLISDLISDLITAVYKARP